MSTSYQKRFTNKSARQAVNAPGPITREKLRAALLINHTASVPFNRLSIAIDWVFMASLMYSLSSSFTEVATGIYLAFYVISLMLLRKIAAKNYMMSLEIPDYKAACELATQSKAAIWFMIGAKCAICALGAFVLPAVVFTTLVTIYVIASTAYQINSASSRAAAKRIMADARSEDWYGNFMEEFSNEERLIDAALAN